MNVSTPAIVLAVIKYNDADAIVKTYTAQTGFTSFYIKGFFKGKKARSKKALFQPNALLEITFDYKNKDSLEHLREARLLYHYKQINTHFDKLNVSTFLREVLLESLKNEQADAALFRFIYQSFIRLDQEKFHPDFHLIFLLKLTQFLGFYPDLQTPGTYFDMQNARFTGQLPLGAHLNQADSLWLKQLLGTIFAAKNIKITQKDRQKLIEIILKYYQQHITNFNWPKSIKILNQIYE